MRECDDPKPFLCKIMNLMEFDPQNYLKYFALMLRTEIICMNDSFKDRMYVQDESFKVVYSGQQHMKVYSFMRSTLIDSDHDCSEDSYERNANACFWQNQEDRLHDSTNSNACFSDNSPPSPSASCTSEDLFTI